MAVKFFTLLLLAAFVSQGNSLTEIWLDDRNVDHIIHGYVGSSMGIAKAFWDELRSCNVIFPNGAIYEAYPNSNLPSTNVFFLDAVQPFTSCSIGFRGIGVEYSGTYQLMATVYHTLTSSMSLTRQNFNLNVREMED